MEPDFGPTPIFSVSVGGSDVTSNFNDRLLELELTDNAGKESDEITFTVDDRDFAVTLPQRGDTMDVQIGYAETGMVDKGTFEVSDVSGEGPPFKITVHGKSASMRDDQKSQRINNYQGQSLPDIVNTIAQRHGLQASVDSDSFSDITWDTHNQDKESDWHLLQRHSRSFDATFAVKNGTLIFNSASSGSNASGQSMPTVELDLTDILTYEFKQGDRPKHKTVKASWYDRTKGQRVHEEVDVQDTDSGSSSAEATHHVRHLHHNQAHAQHAAQAKAAKLQRAEASVTVEITGDPTVAADGTMVISTGRDGLDGEWIIKSVVHTYGTEGYKTKITGEAQDSVGSQGNAS